ncbi:transglutaminase-like domain-containing protein [Acetivibrio saccincola]|uniref:transglutaminase-like domain-containing protein n=1 Tax=Acetivibrio saccincola TaxID=1677857 RepID=UPI002CBD39BA|nr:transglutaminase-like domain-containing protein [Acetivibrio saccincola]HQD28482.1 transglutaminase-like domain-containing protein [Acetivibrio saccincola]
MKDKLKDYKNYILPFLFSVTAAYWSMNSLFGVFMIEIFVIILLTNVFLFTVCIYLKGKGIKGGVLFILVSFIYAGVSFAIIGEVQAAYRSDFIIWFIKVTSGEIIPDIAGFCYGTTLLATYFFACTVFYFTCIRFRIFSIFLISIVSFLFQSTNVDNSVGIVFVIFLVLFFMLYVDKTRRDSTFSHNEGLFQINKWYFSSITFFVLIPVFFSILLPKPNTKPKLAELDRVISQAIQTGSFAIQNIIQNEELLGLFNPMDYGGNRYIGALTAPLTENVLFEVEAQEPLYLKNGSWDKYEKNWWILENKSLTEGHQLDKNITRLMKIDAIVRFFERLEHVEGVDGRLDKLIDIAAGKRYTLISNKEREAVIESNYPIEWIFVTTDGVTDVKLIGGKKVYKNELGFCFLDKKESSYTYDRYSFNYVSKDLPYSSKQFQIMRLLNKEMVNLLLEYKDYILEENESVEILRYREGNPNFTAKEKMILDEIIEEMNIAYDNFTSLPEKLPKRIYTLAEKIVAGKTSDYEKALAIEQFFHNSGYVYDLAPPKNPNTRDYVDFFIFESKRGICVHYATAMVILARAAGLPARYVEGYVAKELDKETGKYVVKEKHGHAFPEVYIAGYGWMIFEPTVSDESDSEFILFLSNMAEKIKAMVSYIWTVFLDAPLWIKLLLVPYLIIVFWIFVRLFIYVKYRIWEKRVYKYDGKKALESIFKKINFVLKKTGSGIKKHETPLSYAARVLKEQNIDIYSFVHSFNKCKYGGIEPAREDIKRGVDTFKEIKKHVKRNSGKLKSMFI